MNLFTSSSINTVIIEYIWDDNTTLKQCEQGICTFQVLCSWLCMSQNMCK